MKTFRIFTNDRGMRRSIPLYSCYAPVEDVSAEAAEQQAQARFGPFTSFPGEDIAPIKAIEWPPDEAGKKWLAKHVDVGV